MVEGELEGALVHDDTAVGALGLKALATVKEHKRIIREER